MADMVEKVARGIWNQRESHFPSRVVSALDQATPWTREMVMQEARAALKACHFEELVALLEQAFDSRAPDYAEAAHKGWCGRVRAALAKVKDEGHG